jgi:hypothetical protein
MDNESILHCAHPGCTATIPNHAWGRIKSDWFQQKDGLIWCTQHIPEWVAEWRARKKEAVYNPSEYLNQLKDPDEH